MNCVSILSGFAATIVGFSSVATQSPAALKLETSNFRFTITCEGQCELYDKQAHYTWQGAEDAGFGKVRLLVNGKPEDVTLRTCELDSNPGSITATFRPSKTK